MADADIISRMQLNARPFSEGLDQALKQAEGAVSTSAARVNADLARYSGTATNSARDVVQAYGRVAAASTSAARTGEIVAASANRQRGAYQQLGFQLSDVVAQASTGTNAFVILAQQGGQTAAALATMGGRVGAVATFLAGPFGAAVFGAVTVLGLLATRLGDSGDAAKSAADDFETAAGSATRLEAAIKRIRSLDLNSRQNLAKDVTQVQLDLALAERQRADLQRRIAANGGSSGAQANEAAARLELLDRRVQELQGTLTLGENRLRDLDKQAAERAAKDSETKAVASARREQAGAQKELRAAEKAREAALLRELELVDQQGARIRELADTTARLEGGFGTEFDRQAKALGAKFPGGSSIFDAGGTSEIQAIVDRELGKAFGDTTEKFRNEGIVAAQAIAQAFGGGVGVEVSKIAGVLRGLSTGDFTSVGGPLGGAATLLAKDPATRRALGEAFKPVADSLSKTLEGLGESLGISGAGNIGGQALSGFAIGSAIGGNTESGIGGAIGGAAGGALGTAIGGPIGGAIGTALGSVIGSGIGGLFASAKKGSVTLGSSGGEFTVGQASGNSASRRANATSLGGSVADSLNRIAESLGAGVGQFAVSVGQRDGVFSVDTSGRGNVSKKYGAKQFATAEEAARFAISDAINDGALTGLSQSVLNAIKNASSLEAGLDDAVAIQSIAKRLREIDDPIGSAADALEKEFQDLADTLREAGGSASEFADLQRLYAEEQKALAEASVSTLRGFLSELNVGSSSPLSLGDQRRTAEAAFAQFESDIRAGKSIDQAAFVTAGRNLLDVERQISGGTQDYFSTFNRVQGATNSAISGVENATAIRDLELAAAAKSTADSTAASVNILNDIRTQLERMNSLSGGGGGFVGADAISRGFVRAA